jgi:uncharacterized protein with HEPN domain
MQPEARTHLYDIKRAADLLAEFTTNKTFTDYESDPLLRSAVERQFEIIGEALARLTRLDPAATDRISEHRRIIAFRNILAHGYDQVDSRIVWEIVETKVPTLCEEEASVLS